MNDILSRTDRLNAARELVACLEQGDEDAADRLLDELQDRHRSALFQTVGELTRQINTTLNRLSQDSGLAEIARADIAEARERLKSVIAMSEKSAHETLKHVESLRPLVTGLQHSGSAMRAEAGRLQTALDNILAAQSSQDLGGQLVHQVLGLIEHTESALVAIIRSAGAETTAHEERDREERVTDQQDVDDLLSSLGF